MSKRLWLVVVAVCVALAGNNAEADDSLLALQEYTSFEGFINAWWDESSGSLLLRVEDFGRPFLYQVSLPRGVGSNDIGLARRAPRDAATRAHYAFAQHEIVRLLADPAALEKLVPPGVPPGSPIGSTTEQAP